MRKNISRWCDRQVDVELDVLLLGLRGETRAADALVVAVHLVGVGVGARLGDLRVDELVEPRELGRGLRAPKVLVDAPFSQLAAGAVPLLDDPLFDLQNLLEERPLPLPVVRTDGHRALEEQVLEEVGASETPGLFDHGTETRQDLARDSWLRVIFENEDAKPVVERGLPHLGHRR